VSTPKRPDGCSNYELHATKFGSGRSRPSGTDWDLHKANRATTRDTLDELVDPSNTSMMWRRPWANVHPEYVVIKVPGGSPWLYVFARHRMRFN